MTRFFRPVFLTVLGLSLAMAAEVEAQTTQKFGYVNSQQLVAQAPGTEQARSSLEAEMQGFRTELDSLEAELDSLQSTYERQQSSLSATARQERQQEIQQKFVAYQQRATELQQTAQRREQEVIGPLMQRIAGVIEEVRKEGGYSMIFDASAGSFIVAADPGLDLTEQVLARLRSDAGGATSSN